MRGKHSSRRLFVIVLTLVVVFAVAVMGATAEPTAGQVQDGETTPVAEDVPVGSAATTQSISVPLTLANSSTTELEVDLSAVAAQGITSRVAAVNVTDPGVTANNDSSIGPDNTHTIRLTETGTTPDNTVTVTVVYEHNTSALSPANVGELAVPISDSTTLSETARFNLVYDTETVSRSPANDIVFNSTAVYAGEDNVTFVDTDGREVPRETLIKTAGSGEGTTLQLDETSEVNTGTYAENQGQGSGNFEVLLREPRITTANLQIDGETVTAIASGSANTDDLRITAEWNFAEAEALEVTVTDPSGTEITDEVVASPRLNDSAGEGSVGLNMQDEDPGEYTIEFDGVDGLGDEEYSFTLVDADEFAIESTDSALRGDDANFSITGAPNDQYHLVTVEASDFRDNLNTEKQVFRNVGDTVSVGYATADGVTSDAAGNDTVNASNAAYAYAVVQIEETEAAGEIDTTLLKDTAVTVTVYSSADSGGKYYDPSAASIEPLDSTDFTVREGTVTLTSPTNEYTIGQSANITGEAAGADQVRIYVYDEGVWLPVEIDDSMTIPVDDEGVFDVDNVVLSAGNASGNTALSFADQYRLGVITEASVPSTRTTRAAVTGPIEAPEFAAATTDQQSLVTRVGRLSADLTTYNNEVATADGTVTVSGTAPTDTVVVVFTDTRGNLVAREVSADEAPESDANRFVQRDISLSPLANGPITTQILSPGRDGVFGDGEPVADSGDLRAYLTTNITGNGRQVRERIAGVTTAVNGSDDQTVTEQFRLTDGRVAINRVGPVSASQDGVTPVEPGESLLVQGITNRDPGNVALTVEVVNQHSEVVASELVKEWDESGAYYVVFDSSGLEPGAYIARVSDLQATDQVEFELVGNQTNASTSAAQTTETEDTDTPASTPPETHPSRNQQSPPETDTTEVDTETHAEAPGFGVLGSVVTVILFVVCVAGLRE